MLVVTRKAGQQIVIDGQITITIVKIQGNRLSLGIEAPRDIAVHRAEILFDRPEADAAALSDVLTHV